MFTGIVETVGEVISFVPSPKSARLGVLARGICSGVGLGDSIAINGACLTVSAMDGERLDFDAVRETLDCTNLGGLGAGSQVNLERALQMGDRFDGHIVQGHVDATGEVVRLEKDGEDVRLQIACGPGFGELLVNKGSVTIDGVSLTVVTASTDGFDVALIPTTLRETTLGSLGPGSVVNLEADILGKYVRNYLVRLGSEALPKIS